MLLPSPVQQVGKGGFGPFGSHVASLHLFGAFGSILGGSRIKKATVIAYIIYYISISFFI